jgi:threonine dehydrogenase-like Zn-dependent dehydrogenase
LIPGHEFSGCVVEVGVKAKNYFQFGDKVTVFPMICCMECNYCHERKFRDCESKLSLGFQLPGAFADEVIVDSRFIIRMKEGLSYEQGALVEHLSCGYRLAKEVASYQLPLESHIVLIGDGPISLADLQMLIFFNYKNITVIGKNPLRMQLALKLGASQVINFQDTTLAKNIKNNANIDVCIFAAPADNTLMQILPFIRSKGILFPQTSFKSLKILDYLGESNIVLGRAFAYEFEDFENVMKLINDEKICTDILVSERVKLSELPTRISAAHAIKSASKIMIINEGFDLIVEKYKRRKL